VWEVVADRFGDAPALHHGDRSLTWSELDRRADGVASTLLAAGIGHQGKVAQYLRNRPEYLESLFGIFKVALVPVNTNYRYGDDELAYLWDNSDTEAVVFDAEFAATAGRVRERLGSIRLWLCVGPEADCPPWATPYEQAATASTSRVVPPWGRSGDDLYLLYTGGTTGQPKGVMWPQDDLFRMLEAQQNGTVPDPADPEAFVAQWERPGVTALPAAPLMHGTACWFAMPILSRGGAIVTLTSPSLDPVELLDTVVARKVKGICIVGEAFARPLLRELEADPERWDLTGVRLFFSSGAMLSDDSKRRLLHFAPKAQVVDGLGSSESGSLGTSVTKGETTATTATFRLNANTRVIDDEGRDVEPGSGQAGRLAVGGHLPLGYYKDPAKTAATFVEVDGRRYVVAGDWAQVSEEGTITLLGRGSSCINTAGEKVFPEEVEETLKAAAGVHDAAVVGLPDERFGEAVTALVEPDPGATLDERALIAHVKAHLAAYKAPKRVLVVDTVGRGANGKLDHRALKERAAAIVGG
jgi:fatty-acyl-CoA synthase